MFKNNYQKNIQFRVILSAFSGQPKKSTDLCYINSAGWVEYQIRKNFIHPWKKRN